MITILPKDVQEIVTEAFDYSDKIGAAAISGAVLTVSVVAGVDAAPANLLSGVHQVVGSKVEQKLKDGVDGVRYKVKCVATLSDGRKLVRTRLVDVKTL